MTVKKEPRGGQTSAAGNGILRHGEHIPTPAHIQVTAIESAGEVCEVAERLLSAFWKALCGSPVDPALDFTLTVEHFPTPVHWAVCRALIAHAEHGRRPTIHIVRSVAEFVGYLPDTDDGFDLIRRIPSLECSAAGLGNYASNLIDFARRRALYHVLTAAAGAALDIFEPTEETARGVADTIQAWRAGGADLPKPPRMRRQKMPNPRLRGRVIK